MIDQNNIVGVVLAGGQSTRMGDADKLLMPLGDRPVIEAVLTNLGTQISTMAINTNSSAAEFDILGAPLFPDTLSGFQGPLAGLLASMLWVRQSHRDATHIMTVAGDSPFFPATMVKSLITAAPDNGTIVMAESGGFNHPVFALWPTCLCDDLQKWLTETGNLKVMAWVRTHPHIFVDFPFKDDLDPFFNINTPEDLVAANEVVARELL